MAKKWNRGCLTLLGRQQAVPRLLVYSMLCEIREIKKSDEITVVVLEKTSLGRALSSLLAAQHTVHSHTEQSN
jgi:hypothetical protein